MSRSSIRAIALTFGLMTLAPAAHADVPVWLNLGGNMARVDKADHNCPGGQAGFGFGRRLMVKGQRAGMSFEADDDGGDCDLGLWGDTTVRESALMAGLAAPNGLFVVAGPAAMEVEDQRGPSGSDTGTRFEVGYQSRLNSKAVSGLEVALFFTDNDVRNYGGLALSWTVGSRGTRVAKPRKGAGRY